MKLYMHPVSMTTRPVRLFIAENNIPMEEAFIDLMKGEHMQPPYEMINPNRLVPVLEDGDFRLTEHLSARISGVFKRQDGYVDQVVRSARRTYATRAARVTDALRPHAEPILPVAGMYATVPLPQARALRARASARAAGFEVPLLSDYCRTARLTGLIIGFGGCTDDELDRALAALVGGLS